ncbi:hypothetical protein ACFL07_04340 [Pseudomonadota bacterium]
MEANTAYAQSDLVLKGNTLANSNQKWKVLAESIGITAIVLSLVFVGLQLRQAQVIARNEVGLQELENRIAANGQINDRVNVWLRGLAGQKLSGDDAAIFENLLINVNDISFFSSSNYYELGEIADARTVTSDLAIFLHRNPGARQVWEAREKRLGKARKIVEAGLMEDAASLDIPYVEWVTEALENLDQEAK